MSTSSTLRGAFIGAGHHAYWTLYPCFQFLPEVELAAVCDLDEAKAQLAARQFGAAEVFTDYRAMLDRVEPQVLFCCGGPSLHVKVIAEAIDRKLPLFVEKPPAATAAELIPLVERAEATGVAIMVGFMRRFATLVEWARSVMARPEFGRVMMLYGREGIWASDPGNVVLDSGIHVLDLMRYLGGDVQCVQAVRASDEQSRTGVAALLQFRSGAIGHVGLNSLESFSVPNNIIEIHGQQGSFIRIDNWSTVTWHRDGGGLSAPGDPMHAALTYEQPWNQGNVNRAANVQGYIPEMRHFVESVRKGTPLRSTLRDGWRALQLVEAVVTACRTGEPVIID